MTPEPGDLLLWEAWFYLIVPSDSLVPGVIRAEKEPGGPEPLKSVSVHQRWLFAVRDTDPFRQVLKLAAQHLLDQHSRSSGETWYPEWRRWLFGRADELADETTAWRVTGRRVWYPPSRLFPNPNPLAIPLPRENAPLLTRG